jgi:hypothetical protein
MKVISGRRVTLAVGLRSARATDPPILSRVSGVYGCGAHLVATVA